MKFPIHHLSVVRRQTDNVRPQKSKALSCIFLIISEQMRRRQNFSARGRTVLPVSFVSFEHASVSAVGFAGCSKLFTESISICWP